MADDIEARLTAAPATTKAPQAPDTYLERRTLRRGSAGFGCCSPASASPTSSRATSPAGTSVSPRAGSAVSPSRRP